MSSSIRSFLNLRSGISKWLNSGKNCSSSFTPPASWYTTKEMLSLENASVFRKNWIAVGTAADVRKPMEYISGHIGREPYVVVRDEKDELKAFFNVCRHHAAHLVHGNGQLKECKFECPYHGWNYRVSDGRLLKAPRVKGIEDFRAKDYGLHPMNVHVEGEVIFVDPSNSLCATDFNVRYGSVLGEFDWKDFKFHSRQVYELNCNWKVFVDNYLDGGLHVPILHKDLSGSLSLDTYVLEVPNGYSSIQRVKGDENDPRIGQNALYGFVYPNFMINQYGNTIDTNVVYPVSESECLVVFDYYMKTDPQTGKVLAGNGDAEEIARELKASDGVQQEDIYICESVQRGLESSVYDVGRYVPATEEGAFMFHRQLGLDMVKHIDETSP